jgi:hypothetical protein
VEGCEWKCGGFHSLLYTLTSISHFITDVHPFLQIVLGPWRLLNAGTGSHAEILILIALVRSVKKWLEDEYWIWLCRNVLDWLR